jgi:putative addiction module component (TIGR02574 family)
MIRTPFLSVVRCKVDVNTVLREVETWPVEDQVQLAEQLWDRLEDQRYDPELTDDQKAELDRRLADYEENPSASSSWEAVKARLWGGS